MGVLHVQLPSVHAPACGGRLPVSATPSGPGHMSLSTFIAAGQVSLWIGMPSRWSLSLQSTMWGSWMAA